MTVIGIIVALAGVVIDAVIALNHRGQYWRAFRWRLGFFALAIVATVAWRWATGHFVTAMVFLVIGYAIAVVLIHLFETRRGRIPSSVKVRFGEVGSGLTIVGFLLAVLGWQ